MNQVLTERTAAHAFVRRLQRLLPLAMLIASLVLTGCGQNPGGGSGPGY